MEHCWNRFQHLELEGYQSRGTYTHLHNQATVFAKLSNQRVYWFTKFHLPTLSSIMKVVD